MTSASEQFHQNCKIFAEQLARVERHIKDQKIYTSFDFAKLSANLAQYRTWVQANIGVIDAALSAPPDGEQKA